MFVETRRLAEALGADVALVRPVFLVHVQDVDAQPVALLKRPATRQSARGVISHELKMHAGVRTQWLDNLIL